jgi:hypothetical protein
MHTRWNPLARAGAWFGLVIGAYDESGRLLPEALEYLSRGSYRANSSRERGIRLALVRLGYLKRWCGGIYHIRTKKPIPYPWEREAERKAWH